MAGAGGGRKKSEGPSTSLITDAESRSRRPTEVTLGRRAPGARAGTAAARPSAGTHRGYSQPTAAAAAAHPAHPPAANRTLCLGS